MTLARAQPRADMDGAAVKERVNKITKSPLDTRDYTFIRLQNDMKVLLISDKDTDKAAAALSVNVGYMSDPDALPGMAHLCEHMLFLGTDKYPVENEYREFLISHGGGSNAYTSTDTTNYYFDVAHDHLMGALDRFAQFFLSPLFNADMTDREIKAVDSENEKNLQSDQWRLKQIEKHTAKEGHPYRKFGTGNKETLDTVPSQKGINVREELLKFHLMYYSSNVMCLTVLGRESLDELTAITTQLFTSVVNKNNSPPFYPNHPYGPDQLQLCIQYCPVKDLRQIVLEFPLPDLTEQYKAKPSHYFAHLIGHEAPGSILSLLRARGWSTTLAAGPSLGARGFWFFKINLTLTEDGQDHVDDIVTVVFQYIAMLRSHGAQQWIFTECADLSAMEFRFKDKESPGPYVTTLSSHLHNYPVEDILSFRYAMTEFNEELYYSFLDHLQPQYVRLTIVNKKYEGTTSEVEPWYGSCYSITKLDPSLVEGWKCVGSCDDLHLPARNDFIPTNFDLHPLPENPPRRPVMIKDTAMSRVWFKQDNTFRTPKAHIYIALETPAVFQDARSVVMTKLLVMLLEDALVEFTYNATIAGTMYFIQATMRGIDVKIRGFSEKQFVLLGSIIKKLVDFVIDDKKFAVYKEQLLRNLRNFQLEEPYKQVLYYMGLLCAERGWTKEQCANVLQSVTVPMLQSFVELFLSRLHLEMLLHGNMTRQQAVDLVTKVESLLVHTQPLLPSQQLMLREVKLPSDARETCGVFLPKFEACIFRPYVPAIGHWVKIMVTMRLSVSCDDESSCNLMWLLSTMKFNKFIAIYGLSMSLCTLRLAMAAMGGISVAQYSLSISSFYRFTATNAVHCSCCVGAYYQIGLQSFRDNATLELFNQIVREPCFNTLRTKEQLGYIVATIVVYSRGTEGFFVLVQSERDVHHVESRIDQFLSDVDGIVSSLDDKAFQTHVKALEVKKLEKPKKLVKENAKYLTEIESRQYCFDRDEAEVECLKKLDKTDIVTFYQKQIAGVAPERSKLSIHVLPATNKEKEAVDLAKENSIQEAATPRPIDNISSFRNSLSLYPFPLPEANIKL